MNGLSENRQCVSFIIHKKAYTAGNGFPCSFRCHDYTRKEGDKIGIYKADNREQSDPCSSVSALDALSAADDTFSIILEWKIVDQPGQHDYEFHYIDGTNTLIGKSATFKISANSSDDNILTMREISSLDDATLLVDKLSIQGVSRLGDENKNLREELVKVKDEKKNLERKLSDILKENEDILAELKSEREKKSTIERDYEEMSVQVTEQMSTIQKQSSFIEELERKVKLEEAIKSALDEEIENQRDFFESGIAEVEDSRALAVRYKAEYRRALEKLEEDRVLYEETIIKLEDELSKIKQKCDRSKSELLEENQDLSQKLTLTEERYMEKLNECLVLEDEAGKLNKDLDQVTEEGKKKEKELLDKLEAFEKERASKGEDKVKSDTGRHKRSSKKSTIGSDLKLEEMKVKLSALENENAKYKEQLKEKSKKCSGAERKLKEMEEIVVESKKDLMHLKKAVVVSTSDTEVQTENRKRIDIGTGPDEPEYEESQRREYYRGGKGRRNYGRGGRTYGRGGNRRGDRYNEDSYRRRGQNIAAMDRGALEKQFYIVRQHRNSLLRYNSRLKHSVGMLNHDCAILQYNIQQILADSEHRISSFQSLYHKKESECAMLEAQLQSLLSQTDVYCQTDKVCDDGYTMSFTPVSHMGSYYDGYPNGMSSTYVPGGTLITSATPIYQDNCSDMLTQPELSQEFEHRPVIIEMTPQQHDEESGGESPDEQGS